MKLIEEKQEIIKENKDLRLSDKQSNYSTKANTMQNDHLNNLLTESQKELTKWKSQYNLLLEKLESIPKEKTKNSSEKDLKNHEVR